MAYKIEFKWKGDFQPKQLIQRCSAKLPLLVKVTQGFDGTDEEDKFSYSNEEVYWIYDIHETEKLVLKDASGIHISIPSDYPLNFHLIDDDGEYCIAEPLSLLSKRLDDGDKIIAEDDANISFRVGDNFNSMVTFGQLTVVTEYQERTLVGYHLLGREVQKEQVVIPAYISISLALADSLEHGEVEDFHKVIDDIKESAKKIRRRPVEIQSDIMLFEDDVEKMKIGDYDYIKPENYLRCNQLQRKPTQMTEGTECKMTASAIYDKHLPTVPSRLGRSDPRKNARLPARPPKGRRENEPVIIDPHSTEAESENIYDEATIIADIANTTTLKQQEQQKQQQTNLAKKHSLRSVSDLFKKTKEILNKPRAIIKPQPKTSNSKTGPEVNLNQKGNDYGTTGRKAKQKLPPLKPKKQRPGSTTTRKELPPLPDESQGLDTKLRLSLPQTESGDTMDDYDDDNDDDVFPDTYEISHFPSPTQRSLSVPTSEKGHDVHMAELKKRLSMAAPDSAPKAAPRLTKPTPFISPIDRRDGDEPNHTNVGNKKEGTASDEQFSSKGSLTPVYRESISMPSPETDNGGSTNVEDKEHETSFTGEKVFKGWEDVPEKVESLSVSEIGSCLELLQLSKYKEAFEDGDIDGEMLISLTRKPDILTTDFNFTNYECMKLCKFVQKNWRPKLGKPHD